MEWGKKVNEHYKKQAEEFGDSKQSTMKDIFIRDKEVQELITAIKKINEHLDETPTILEIGCGNGYFAEQAGKELPNKIIGIDFSNELLKIAQHRNLKNCQFQYGDALRLDFADNYFNIVFTERCLINLNSWESQKKALKEIWRVLKPTGFFITIEAFTDSWKNLNQAREAIGLEPIPQPFHNNFLDKDSFFSFIEGKFELADFEQRPNFLSSYYFGARVLYPALIKKKKEIVYNNKFVEFFSYLSPSGNYNPIQLFILKKRMENNTYNYINKLEEKGRDKHKVILLSSPYITEEEIFEVTKVLKLGILSLGPKLKEFEQKFAELTGTKYAVGINSGTSGLHLCVRALGIKENDEVITTPFSFIATANCLLYEKATPVFVDVEEDSFNIDPNKIEAAITPKTKAILVAHIFGQSCNMTKIVETAKKHNLRIIEDACESINATHYRQKVGTFGDVAVFAFYPNKQITTGEGGMITTNNKEIYEYCKSASNQGRSEDMQWLTHDKLGYNYRLDEMSAALGIAQLNKVESLIKKRQEIAAKYIQELLEIKEITLPKIKPENTSTWFVFPIRVKEKIRDKLIQKLNEKGIQSKAYFYPCIHLQPFYQETFGYREGAFPIAEKLSRETLILPFYPAMSKEQVLEVKERLKESLNELCGKSR